MKYKCLQKEAKNIMDLFTVAFFGHRYIDDPMAVEDLLEEEIRSLFYKHEYIAFLVGKNGEFDICAASAVRKAKQKYGNGNSDLTLMLPYKTAEYTNNERYFEEYYDCIEISHSAENAHPKAAIEIRNKDMVDRADLVMCFVENNFGGAYKALKYAKSQHKEIINIAEK